MDAKAAKNFYDNYEWFNKFFDDLFYIFDKVADDLTREGFEESSGRQYYKAQRKPSLPNIYSALFSRKAGPRVILSALLQREWKNKKVPSSEPMLFTLVYDLSSDNQWVATNILDNAKGLHLASSDDAMTLSGHLDWDERVGFRGFFVPLDAFSDKNCPDESATDAVIREKIVSPLRDLLDKHFSKQSKKPKPGE
jgi:hypothetical protein